MPKCFVIYRQVFLTFIAGKSLKLPFYFKLCTNNDFKLSRFAFDVSQKFKALPCE